MVGAVRRVKAGPHPRPLPSRAAVPRGGRLGAAGRRRRRSHVGGVEARPVPVGDEAEGSPDPGLLGTGHPGEQHGYDREGKGNEDPPADLAPAREAAEADPRVAAEAGWRRASRGPAASRPRRPATWRPATWWPGRAKAAARKSARTGRWRWNTWPLRVFGVSKRSNTRCNVPARGVGRRRPAAARSLPAWVGLADTQRGLSGGEAWTGGTTAGGSRCGAADGRMADRPQAVAAAASAPHPRPSPGAGPPPLAFSRHPGARRPPRSQWDPAVAGATAPG